MDAADRQATTRGVLLAALLHLGILCFLLLATLSCSSFESAIDALGLPKSWNPVTCTKPLNLSGPVIEATLLGPTGAPLPPPGKARFPKPKIAPPPAPKPKIEQEKPKPVPVKTLPPPPKNPDIKDQEKVVAQSTEKSRQAEHEQKQRQRQRMSELDAQQDQDIDKFFKQIDALKKQGRKAESQAKQQQQKLAKLGDNKNPSSEAPANTPQAKQTQTGNAGTDNSLLDQYKAAINNAITQAWLRPDNIPRGATCDIDIVQIPGGDVISAHVEPGHCQFDPIARQSVENAVMRASPLPYQGFEKVFSREINFHFTVTE